MSYDTWKTAAPDCDFDSREEEGEDEPAPFVPAPKGTRPTGCSLRRRLPTSLTREVMVAKFGAPDPGAFWEPENGYDGDEWVFLFGQGESDARFTVYARWGVFRVGANNVSDEDVDAFVTWLGEELGGVTLGVS